MTTQFTKNQALEALENAKTLKDLQTLGEALGTKIPNGIAKGKATEMVKSAIEALPEATTVTNEDPEAKIQKLLEELRSTPVRRFQKAIRASLRKLGYRLSEHKAPKASEATEDEE